MVDMRRNTMTPARSRMSNATPSHNQSNNQANSYGQSNNQVNSYGQSNSYNQANNQQSLYNQSNNQQSLYNQANSQQSPYHSSLRNVRDPDYMSQSISIINEYLIESNQSNDEQIPLLCGKCPTYKHFQAVFQRTIGFFSSQLSTNNLDTPYKKHSILKNTGINFGEEAHNIIKSMKYPFSHEINKSHLTTTNPHSWPVILSFLRWLVEMIYICKNYIKNEKSDDILTEGYRKFMEGDDYFFENSLRQKSNSENNHLISEMEGLSQVNEVLSSLISQSRDVSHGISQSRDVSRDISQSQNISRDVSRDISQSQNISRDISQSRDVSRDISQSQDSKNNTLEEILEKITDQFSEKQFFILNEYFKENKVINSLKSLKNTLKTRLNDLKADKLSIEKNFIPLQEKEQRYKNSISQIKNELIKLQTDGLIEERNSLITQLNIQNKKLKNIQSQSEKKNLLIANLETIKKEKECILKQINEIDNILQEKNDIHEKYSHDLFRVQSTFSHAQNFNFEKDKFSETSENFKDKFNEKFSETSENFKDNFKEKFNGKSDEKTENFKDNFNFEKDKFNENNFNFEKDKFNENDPFLKSIHESFEKINFISNQLNESSITTKSLDFNLINHLNDLISHLEYNLTLSKDNNLENKNNLINLKNDNLSKNNRIIVLSKNFIKKKEIFELEKLKFKNEMIKIENELLNIPLNNQLLQSEQNLHFNSIKMEKMESVIQIEETEINLIISKFYNEMNVILDELEDLTSQY